MLSSLLEPSDRSNSSENLSQSHFGNAVVTMHSSKKGQIGIIGPHRPYYLSLLLINAKKLSFYKNV